MADVCLPTRSERVVPGGTPVIIAASSQMLEVLAVARRSAAGEAKVLVTGESGVGKDLIAREIHLNSKRAAGPFVAVNCAGLTESLLESELFGHAKGSFTGAYRDKPGKLQLADRGTLFLDEVGEMSLRMQALLLRFLETGEIQSVGAHQPTALVNVRVVAATNRNLGERVSAGEFREDLLYRLRVIHIHVPPLRDRREDIPLLIDHLLKRAGRHLQISEDAVQVLSQYRWPGNVRELQNCIERACTMADGDHISVADLSERIRRHHVGKRTQVPVGELTSLAAIEDRHIRRVLDAVKGNRSLAARILGLDRKTLTRRLGDSRRGGARLPNARR